MTDWGAVKKTIQNWAEATLSPVKVIWAEQNYPPPPPPYATLRVATSTRVGDDYVGSPDSGTGTADITGNRDFTLEVQIMGTGAAANVEKLRSALQKPTSLTVLRAGGVAFASELSQTNITDVVAGTSRYEERESLDLLMRAASAYDDDLGVIEHVELAEKVLDPAGATVIEETTTINP